MAGSVETHPVPASAIPSAGFAATYQTGSPPTNGGQTGNFSRVRTNVTYAGSVTAARIRLYTRLPGGATWFRGASSDDVSPLTPSTGNESRDWQIGAGVEFAFVLESTSPGTTGNTVAVDCMGVAS